MPNQQIPQVFTLNQKTSRNKFYQIVQSGQTKPCFFLFRLARIYARPRIPQAVPWLQEFSRKRKLSLASARLKPIYQPFRYKSIRTPAIGASCRIRAGTKNS